MCFNTCILKVIHSILDGICKLGRPVYQQYGEIFTPPEWWSLVDTYTDLIKNVVKEDMSKDQVTYQTKITYYSRLHFSDVKLCKSIT